MACAKEKFWRRLTEAVGRPELAADERFGDFAARRKNREELVAALDEIFTTRTTEAWLAALGAAGVPCAPVQTVEEALADPGVVERSMIVETEHQRFGTVRSIASPVRVGPQRTDHRRAPTLNEDATYVLEELLNYGPGAVERLVREGAVDAAVGARVGPFEAVEGE